MTKPHSKAVRALGNGGYWAKIVERGLLTLGLGALLWLTTDLHQSVGSFTEFMQSQVRTDARQDQRIDRVDTRVQYLERQGWP